MIRKMGVLFRAFVCVITLLGIVLGLHINVAAVTEYKTEVDSQMFLSKELTLKNCSYSQADGGVQITFLSGSATVEIDVSDSSKTAGTNAIRLVFLNTWTPVKASLTCEYSNLNGETYSTDHRFTIEKSNEHREYIISVPNAERLASVSLFINGSSSATVTMVSVSAISYFFDANKYAGKLDAHCVSDDSGMMNFSGSVSYDTVLSYPTSRLALFRLKVDERVDSVDFNSYLASQPISLEFRFSVELTGISDRLSKYFVAILTDDGKVIPITQCVFLSSELPVRDDGEIAFKGSETELYAWSNEAGCDTSVVDVYLDKALSTNQTGYRYILDKNEYYFSRNYIDQVIKKIKAYTDFGCDVYIRILVNAPNASGGNVKYAALDARSNGTAEKLFALTDLLLSDESAYRIKGFIMGSALDLYGEYNYVNGLGLSEYSELITYGAAVLSQVMSKNNVNLEIVLPVSDTGFGKSMAARTKSGSGSFSSDILLKSVYSCSEVYGIDRSLYSIMLESFKAPILSPKVGTVYGISDDSSVIFAHDWRIVSDLVSEISGHFNVENKGFIFNFRPSTGIDPTSFKIAYAYNYSVLASANGVRSYIVSFLDNSDEALLAGEIREMINYIDTEKGADVTKQALDYLGVGDWHELYDGYKASNSIKNSLNLQQLTKKSDKTITGSFPIWDFDGSGGTEEWESFIGCQSLSVYSIAEGRNRSLVAQMSKESSSSVGAQYESIIYHPSSVIALENISSLSFDVFVPRGVNDKAKYEIVLVLVEEGRRSEYRGVVVSGEMSTFYADIGGVKDVQHIIIGARSISGNPDDGAYFLCIDGISVNSEFNTDDELREIVLSGKLGNSIHGGTPIYFDGMLIVVIAVLCGVTATAVIWAAHAIKKKNTL